MMKLVVLTKCFPYYNTEAFLESEYPYLKEEFSQVIFLPVFKGEKRKSCAESYVCDDYSDLHKKKLLFSIITIFSLHTLISFLKNSCNLFKKNWIKKTFMQEFTYQVLKRVVNKNKDLFDENTIVYSYWFHSAVYAMLKIREENNLNYKVVTRAHRFDVYDEDGDMPNRRYCLERIDKVFPISQDAIDYLSKKYGCLGKYELSRLGVKDYHEVSKQSAENEFHVVSVSQVHPRKRIKEIYMSISKYAELMPMCMIKWTHFGDGPQDKDLIAWRENNRLKNLSIDIKGRVSNSDVMKFYCNETVDVFINLSTSEGVPVSVMEAHSFGIPVIATNVGGTSEVMNDYNGVLLSSNPSIEDVVAALAYIKESNLDRNIIKKGWYSISDASINFPKFANDLKRI